MAGRQVLTVEAVQLHLAMLNDHARTAGYLRAIRDGVREGDVVVDIGTGTGVLAAAAAQAGAHRVYALEVAPIRRKAREVFEGNDLAERIVTVPRLSFRTWLPERADVLVSELIGNEPLAEGVVSITRDAALRFLKPGAHLIPGRVALYAMPLEVPETGLADLAFRPSVLDSWRDAYGIDFSPLANTSEPQVFRHLVKPHVIRKWRALTAPVPVADIRLGCDWPPWVHTVNEVTLERSGHLNAVAVYFELSAGSEVFLSTHPQEAGESGHWESPLQLLDPPLDVDAGARLEIRYWYGFRAARSGCRVTRR